MLQHLQEICVRACICQMKQFPRDFLVKHVLRACRAGGQGAVQEAQPLLTRVARALGPPKGYASLPFSALPGKCQRPLSLNSPLPRHFSGSSKPRGESHLSGAGNTAVWWGKCQVYPCYQRDPDLGSLSICSCSISLVPLLVPTFLARL